MMCEPSAGPSPHRWHRSSNARHSCSTDARPNCNSPRHRSNRTVARPAVHSAAYLRMFSTCCFSLSVMSRTLKLIEQRLLALMVNRRIHSAGALTPARWLDLPKLNPDLVAPNPIGVIFTLAPRIRFAQRSLQPLAVGSTDFRDYTSDYRSCFVSPCHGRYSQNADRPFRTRPESHRLPDRIPLRVRRADRLSVSEPGIEPERRRSFRPQPSRFEVLKTSRHKRLALRLTTPLAALLSESVPAATSGRAV